jgi:hypothetical protein
MAREVDRPFRGKTHRVRRRPACSIEIDRSSGAGEPFSGTGFSFYRTGFPFYRTGFPFYRTGFSIHHTGLFL